MRNLRKILLLAMVIGLIVAAGCSGTSMTDPTINTERIATGNSGPGGGGGQQGPFGPNGEWKDFEVDLERYFDVNYIITLPNEDELEATGMITIFDADGEADESMVLVKFEVQSEDMDHPVCFRLAAGNKTVTVDGISYTGLIEISRAGKAHEFEVVNEFDLLVYEDTTGDPFWAIEGWAHRNRIDIWTLPNLQDPVEKAKDWHMEITGIEVVEEAE